MNHYELLGKFNEQDCNIAPHAKYFVLFNCNAADLLIFPNLFKERPILFPSDEPVPEAEGGDGENHHDVHQGEGGKVQGPDHDADRL